jgi:RNA polymerase sigma-70 factor (ECF subfamily)
MGINMRVTVISSDDSLATRASLLARLKDWEDQGSWQEFFDQYWQLIYRVGLKAGLTPTEAQDAVQETVLTVAKSIKTFKYDRKRCSFKTWLMLIARQRIIWQLRKRLPARSPNPGAKDDTARTATIEGISDPNAVNLDAVWEDEWKRNVMACALERVKQQASPRQFQIFDLYVLQNWPVGEVARTLRISAGQIYVAKHRVSAMLKKAAKRLEQAAGLGDGQG